MTPSFDTDYTRILERINQIDPLAYGKTRNYIDGAVTYLSPYISRGVISTKTILEHVLSKGYYIYHIIPFVKELCWRDYFQRVGQHRDLNSDIRQPQQLVANREIPKEIVNANTGIEGIDTAIGTLCNTGYMHNHCRMYTASVVCNIAKSHWLHPAQWMYYHLLDGDWASNVCSWQWVAGSNSSKKYYANQENINKYTYTSQYKTFLDKSYEALETLDIPEQLLNTQKQFLNTVLPKNEPILIDPFLPTFIYNYYNMDPLWHKSVKGNRVLLLEPDFFDAYPVSPKCIEFLLGLGKNIPDLQVHVGSFESLVNTCNIENIFFKEHPLNVGYTGTADARDWIVESVTGYYPSFFAYWKKIEKQISIKYS